MVDGAGGFDELFGPGYRLIILDQKAEEPRICGDGGGDVEVAVVGGPPERGAQVGQFGGEPVVRLALSGAVPQRQDVGFTPGEIASMRGPDLGGLAARDELLLGELADRLQHRKPGPPRRPVGDEQRLAHQRVEKIQNGVVIDVIESGHRAGALEVKSPGEHRTPFQQRLFRVVEEVVGPRHRVAQRVVACQAAP